VHFCCERRGSAGLERLTRPVSFMFHNYEACACCTGQGKAARKLFLVKSEPHEYSVDDLGAERSGVGMWDGVRSYQARNVLRSLAPGDQGLFYHSQRGKARSPAQAALHDPAPSKAAFRLGKHLKHLLREMI
jgi:hypothetical protein